MSRFARTVVACVLAAFAALPAGAQGVPSAPAPPGNAIPERLADAGACAGRRGLESCGFPAVLAPRPLPPIGVASMQGSAVPFMASGHGPNVPFAPDAGPLFLHRVTKARQAHIDAEVAQAAKRVRAARQDRP